MTIRNLDLYIGSLWDWGVLDDCFGGTRIKVTDIDGIVERKGKFLILEGKNTNTPIPVGQKIMFNHMVNSGLFSVIVIWGKPNKPEKLLMITKEGEILKDPVTVDELKSMVSGWYRLVDNGHKPSC